jgi:hypothetical protein
MVYVDGDRKSLLMCTEDKQTFPPIETPAIPPPAMFATPQLVDQIWIQSQQLLYRELKMQFV